MPPVRAARHLLEHLFSVGPAHRGAEITFGEIESWKALTGVQLTPWEARLLRELSREYVVETIRARKPGAAAPWIAPGQAADKLSAAAAMRAHIKGLARS